MRLCVLVSVSHGPLHSEMKGNLLMFHHRAITVQLLCQSRLFTITSANSVDHTFHVLMRSGSVVMKKLGGTQNGPKCQWDTDVSGLLVREHQPLPTNLMGCYAAHVPGARKRSKDGRWRCPRTVKAQGAFPHHLPSSTSSSPPSTRRLPCHPIHPSAPLPSPLASRMEVAQQLVIGHRPLALESKSDVRTVKDTCCSTIISAVSRAQSLFSAMPARSCLYTKRPSKSVVADLHTPDKQRCFDGWWCPQWVPQPSCIRQRSRYDPERGRQNFDVPTRMTRGVLLHTGPFSHKTENTVARSTHVPEVRADELWRVQEETEIRKPVVKGRPATSHLSSLAPAQTFCNSLSILMARVGFSDASFSVARAITS